MYTANQWWRVYGLSLLVLFLSVVAIFVSAPPANSAAYRMNYSNEPPVPVLILLYTALFSPMGMLAGMVLHYVRFRKLVETLVLLVLTGITLVVILALVGPALSYYLMPSVYP